MRADIQTLGRPLIHLDGLGRRAGQGMGLSGDTRLPTPSHQTVSSNMLKQQITKRPCPDMKCTQAAKGLTAVFQLTSVF